MCNEMHKTLIFLHIPKTGGTTLTEIIERQYDVNNVFNIKRNFQDSIQKLIKLGKKSERVACIKGHITFGIHRYLPGEFTYITLLRDPVEKTISEYYYIQRSPEHPLFNKIKSDEIDIKKFTHKYLQNNSQTKLIAGQQADENTDANKILELAKENIRQHFAFVGITEMFDESLLVMQNIFKWNNIFYNMRNVTAERPGIQDLPLELIDSIRDTNKADIELYNFAKDLLIEKFKNLELNNKKVKFQEEKQRYNLLFSKIEGFNYYNNEFLNSKFVNYIIGMEMGIDLSIFGTGRGGRIVFNFLKEVKEKLDIDIQVKYFFDNDSKKWNNKFLDDKIIYKPTKELVADVDKVIISSLWKRDIFNQLLEMGINKEKLISAL